MDIKSDIKEQALNLISNVTSPSELHGIIEWAEKKDINPKDLRDIVDAAAKKKQEME